MTYLCVQGITPGCKDIYYYNIDCQWIDVTDLPLGSPLQHLFLTLNMVSLIIDWFLGTYLFKMAINPEYKVPETSFENNCAICTLYYRKGTLH
jgi:lysyl oxidase-like protein 2/3/4